MASGRRAWQTLSFRERYWPGVRSYAWSGRRIAGMVPVILVSLIIAVAYFVAVPVSLIPLARAHRTLATVLLVVFHFIYLNVVANYFLLVWSDPGGVPADWKLPPPSSDARSVSDDEDDFEDLAIQGRPLVNRRPGVDGDEPDALSRHPFKHWHLIEERSYDGGWRYCRKCEQLKPDRSHHCSMCSRCVLRMDHHCVFIGTCVGFLNHKFFLSFVFYAFLGCTFVAVVGFPQFLHAIGEGPGMATHSVFVKPLVTAAGGDRQAPVVTDRSSLSEMGWVNPALWSATLVVGYILTSAFSFALAIFVVFHGYLVARGRTTIEMYDIVDPGRAARIARYNLGARENVRLVFGQFKSHWPLPTRYGIEGDGLSYSRADDGDAGAGEDV